LPQSISYSLPRTVRRTEASPRWYASSMARLSPPSYGLKLPASLHAHTAAIAAAAAAAGSIPRRSRVLVGVLSV
jgi:hypothetical protein